MADLSVLVRQLQEQLGGAAVTAGVVASAGGLTAGLPGVDSVTRSALGAYAINFTPGFFSAAPYVVGMIGGDAGGACVKQKDGTTPTATLFEVFTFVSTTAGLADKSFYFVALGLSG